jgi:hypothetical protein
MHVSYICSDLQSCSSFLKPGRMIEAEAEYPRGNAGRERAWTALTNLLWELAGNHCLTYGEGALWYLSRDDGLELLLRCSSGSTLDEDHKMKH